MPSVISATTTNGVAISPDNSGSLQLATNNGTTAVTIDTNQNVGVGTTNPPNYSSSLLTVAFNKSGGVVHNYNVNDTRTGSIVCQSGGFDIGTYTANTPLVLSTNSTQRMVIDSSGNVGIGTSSPTVSGSTATTLYLKGISGNQALLSVASNDAASSVQFWSGNGSTDNPAIAYQKSLRFGSATDAGVGGFTERMRITSGGSLLIGRTGQINQEDFGVTTTDDVACSTNRASSTSYYPWVFYSNSNVVGYIFSTSTATTYSTSSDYRLKENIAPMTGALAKVQQLKPVTYNWKVDGSAGQGFIAHELQEVVPDCVTGEKDAVDEEGKPIYQGVDTSFLVATLTAAIQELKAELDTVKAELASTNLSLADAKAELNTLKNPPVEGTE